MFGCQGLQNAAADGETRSLVMHHMHTGEDINITYKRNGKYDDAALEKINWFLRDWRRQEQTRMDPHLLDVIWEVYRDTGGSEPIQIVCGYRSPATNALLRRRSHGVAQFSQHMLGKATDFYIPGVALEQLRYAGLRMQRGGVGFYPTSGSPFVHLDTGNVRHWPRMAPEMLARVMHDKTVRVATRKPRPATEVVAANEVAPAADAPKPKRSFLAKLFGFAEEGDDEDTQTVAQPAAPSRAPVTVARNEAPAPKPAQVAAAVPLPSARPPRPGRFTVASVAPTSVPMAPTPADIVKSRGEWRNEPGAELPAPPATQTQSAPAPGAIGVNGQRFVWIAGPPGRPTAEAPPRPPGEIAVAAAEPAETTATLNGWPDNARNDRVPTDLALAYAAVPPAERTRSLTTVEQPRAAPQPRQTQPAAAGRPAAPASSLVAKSGPRIEDPWLRGVVMAPSAYYSMRVALLGDRDYRSLTPFMRKPASAVAMGFALDPYAGLSSEYFAGPAVAFVPTITFGTRTAGLN